MRKRYRIAGVQHLERCGNALFHPLISCNNSFNPRQDNSAHWTAWVAAGSFVRNRFEAQLAKRLA